MTHVAAAPLSGIIPASQPERRPRTLLESAAAWALAGVSAVILIVAIGFLITGGRFFVVETPSMGTAAPVGSLVIDRPVDVTTRHVGDVVTYREPTNPTVTYTHRITQMNRDGSFHTRGDINGATDPWALTQHDVVGAPVLLVPYLGWVCKAAPILAIGGLLVWALTSTFTNPITRRSLRIAGACLTVSYAAFVLKALVNVVMITNTVTAGAVHATVVSTGILPTLVQAHGGDSVRLLDGQVGALTITKLTHNGIYQLVATTDLSWVGWLIVGLVCALPLLWCLKIGHLKTVQP